MKMVKEGEVRKKEILMAARELFVQKGYDQTSVIDILKVVDIAKGTFYYYFASKEEVLEAIIRDIVEEGAHRAEAIVQDTSIPVVRRIMLAIMAQAPDFEGSEEIKEEIHKVENAKLERLYMREMLRRMTPVLAGSVAEGIEQGVFATPYPVECIEAVLLLGHLMFDCEIFTWEKEALPQKMQAFLTNMERIFGAREGEMDQIMQLFARNEG